MTLGENIKRIRELRELSVQELADKMNIGKAGIYKWEADENKPDLDSLTALSKALDVTIGELLLENHTYVDKSSDNNQNGHTARETFYRELMEENNEYRLIPKRILDEYEIVPKKEAESRHKMIDVVTKTKDDAIENIKDALLAKHELAVIGFKHKIERLEKENEELRRQIPAKNKR